MCDPLSLSLREQADRQTDTQTNTHPSRYLRIEVQSSLLAYNNVYNQGLPYIINEFGIGDKTGLVLVTCHALSHARWQALCIMKIDSVFTSWLIPKVRLVIGF